MPTTITHARALADLVKDIDPAIVRVTGGAHPGGDWQYAVPDSPSTTSSSISTRSASGRLHGQPRRAPLPPRPSPPCCKR
ncbi:hypothetical protein QNO09_27650 [Streptomyces sp. 378]|uniref:hypothetical protein n=1 Tax=Streptomyces sp. 378 TaxID=3049412 RepID=UPI0024C320E1|nr:hypothetical protein [Streptomyces sp. 378]MDK1347010.1 hypothetical protein [Streptomyces sp. 378]